MRAVPGQVKPTLWKKWKELEARELWRNRRPPAKLRRFERKSVHRKKRLKPPNVAERHLHLWRISIFRRVRPKVMSKVIKKKSPTMNQVKEMKVSKRILMQNRAKSSETNE